MKSSQAIILSAGPNGLGALRGLTKQHVITDVITTNNNEPALFSRLVNRAETTTQERLLETLLTWPGSGQVLIPTSDWYVEFLTNHETLLQEKFNFVLPTGKLSEKFIDKKQEVELVATFTNVPKSLVNLPSTSQAFTNELPLPVIIKPRSNELNKLGQKNIVINDQIQLDEFYRQYSFALEYCIAQELIKGSDENLWVCNCVFNENSDLITAFTFQRLQLTPPHYGVTCYAKSYENQEVIEQVDKIGKGLKYAGPAMVEFKYDSKSQQYKYIEINPRLGLCNYFDTSCGVNNVYATYCVALGLPVEERPKQTHRVFISVYEDLYSRYRDNQSLFTIIKTYLRDLLRPHTFIYFAWRDPLPAIAVGLNQLRSLLKMSIAKLRRKKRNS
ncbi:hypothetical protein [Thalassotalea castellviae]|uniref:ATP-grasp domain-containing protein n=1 Tax=Thalassotalea castellviae TaxID=3075612 RepID=A0ABU3A1I5_9GAMM|nr:hypothetical protein [Thalassotalea sp. W431]MDT0603810.1 hypothetical protein [Thalassotalea sp. W431]